MFGSVGSEAVKPVSPPPTGCQSLGAMPDFDRLLLGPEPVPVYDDPCTITTPRQARELVKVLGSARAVELRGHGSVVLGETMERAFAAAIFLEENSKKQLYATLAGHVTYMTPDEIERTGPNIAQKALEGLWDYYVDQCKLGWR